MTVTFDKSINSTVKNVIAAINELEVRNTEIDAYLINVKEKGNLNTAKHINYTNNENEKNRNNDLIQYYKGNLKVLYEVYSRNKLTTDLDTINLKLMHGFLKKKLKTAQEDINNINHSKAAMIKTINMKYNYQRRLQHNIDLVKYFSYYLMVVFILLILKKYKFLYVIPDGFYSILLFLVSVYALYYFSREIHDKLYSRSSIDNTVYDWDFNPIDVSGNVDTITPSNTFSFRNVLKNSDLCIGESCCAKDTKYNSVTRKCMAKT